MKLGEILRTTNTSVTGDEAFLLHDASRMWEVRRMQGPCVSHACVMRQDKLPLQPMPRSVQR